MVFVTERKYQLNLLIKEINSSYDFRRFSFSASQWKISIIGKQIHFLADRNQKPTQ